MHKLVTENGLTSCEEINHNPDWFGRMTEDSLASGASVRVDCPCLVVGNREFWFTAVLRNSDLSIKSEYVAITELDKILA